MRNANSLVEFLAGRLPGPIDEHETLAASLAASWDKLDGGDAEGMAGYKLHGRMENVKWLPPILTFIIARHGGTVHGSGRAELQEWTVNLDRGEAQITGHGYRQITPRHSPLDTARLAAEVSQLIVERKDDSRLKWNEDDSVRILIGKIVPSESAAKQTVAGRRKRFKKELGAILKETGWTSIQPNLYCTPLNADQTTPMTDN